MLFPAQEVPATPNNTSKHARNLCVLFGNAVAVAAVFYERASSLAERNASAQNVSVAFAQLPLTQVGAPTTNRFSWSCVRPHLSTTDVAGSSPMRQPPAG